MNSKVDFKKMVRFVPSSKANLDRLQFLKESANKPRIAVFGKYNHGKSTLLNALIGKDVFKAADKRETIQVSEYEHQGLIWVDTPGLDADVKGKDDALAKSAFKIADFLFLVHNVKSGELDKYENKIYSELMKQDKNYRAKLFLILTQVDQLTKDDLERVKNRIHQQMPNLTIISVSALRYLRGVSENKPKFIELSGMDALQTLVSGLESQLIDLRKKEIIRLKNKAIIELEIEFKSQQQELVSLRSKQKKATNQFNSVVNTLFSNVQNKINTI